MAVQVLKDSGARAASERAQETTPRAPMRVGRKLVIQIPCLNERETLPETFADLPRHVPGIDAIEVLVIDDGSTDGTSDVAERLGVHHIVRVPENRGLANAFMLGVDAALRLGADVIVNTDADNQYRGSDIASLVAPIVEGRADLVVGDRQTDTIEHFSPLKKMLQRWGSAAVRRASATDVPDSPSGFRAISRKAAYRLFVHNRFTYTVETVVQAGRRGLVLESVPIKTNPKTRESRLFKSIPHYLSRAGPVILRSYAMYRPVQSFMLVAILLFAVGLFGIGRFLYFYVLDPNYSGHLQSLVAGIGSVVLAFIVGLAAMLAELIAMNRRLIEELVERTRRLDASVSGSSDVEGVYTTGATPWGAATRMEAVDTRTDASPGDSAGTDE